MVADDNDVMMLKEQIGNSLRMEARQMNSKNVVFCVCVCVGWVWVLTAYHSHASSICWQLFCNVGRAVRTLLKGCKSPNYSFKKQNKRNFSSLVEPTQRRNFWRGAKVDIKFPTIILHTISSNLMLLCSNAYQNDEWKWHLDTHIHTAHMDRTHQIIIFIKSKTIINYYYHFTQMCK